jgi:hypothetical protein
MSQTGRVATRLATIRARFVWCRMYAVWLGMTRPERTSTLLYLYYPFFVFVISIIVRCGAGQISGD